MGLFQRGWCNGALLQPCTPCLFLLPIPPLLPCNYAAASGLYDHVLPNFSSKSNQNSLHMAKCRQRYGQIEPAQVVFHRVFGATFYDVFIQCEFGFAQMLSMAQLARSHSSLIRAAEDSIQESMPFGNVLANSSWLTVKTELINVERRCS